MLAMVPTAVAADQPTPDPSLAVRPDPAPDQSRVAPAGQRSAPAHDTAGQQWRSPRVPTRVVVAGPTTTANATPGQSATTRSTPARASRRRVPAPARATPPQGDQHPGHASAIATLRRLSPLLAAPQFLRPAAGSSSSGDNSGAQFFLFAAVALLLLVAASASLIRLTTRLSRDASREASS